MKKITILVSIMFISIISFATTQNKFNSTKEVVNNQIINNHGYNVQELIYGGEWRDENNVLLGHVWAVYVQGVFIGALTVAL